MLTPSRALKKDKCTNCTTTFSTTLVVLCNKTRITAPPAEMFLHTRNGFEIDPSQDNNHIRQKIIGDQQASNDSFVHVCWQFSNVSFTPLYKGLKIFQLEYIQHTTYRKQYTRIQKLDSLNISKFILCFVCISKLLRISQQSPYFRNSIVSRV